MRRITISAKVNKEYRNAKIFRLKVVKISEGVIYVICKGIDSFYITIIYHKITKKNFVTE